MNTHNRQRRSNSLEMPPRRLNYCMSYYLSVIMYHMIFLKKALLKTLSLDFLTLFCHWALDHRLEHIPLPPRLPHSSLPNLPQSCEQA